MVDASLTLLHWQDGRRIHRDVPGSRLAEYSAKIVVTLSRHLEAKFGGGSSAPNLSRMIALIDAFPKREIIRHCRKNWCPISAALSPCSTCGA
jgi:hypothetical protein